MDKIKLELGEVQKTLLIPLWGRAVEYGKPHPIVKDPFARPLAPIATRMWKRIQHWLTHDPVREHAQFAHRVGAHLFRIFRKVLLDVTAAIDGAPEAADEHVDDGANRGQQEDRCDRELDVRRGKRRSQGGRSGVRHHPRAEDHNRTDHTERPNCEVGVSQSLNCLR